MFFFFLLLSFSSCKNTKLWPKNQSCCFRPWWALNESSWGGSFKNNAAASLYESSSLDRACRWETRFRNSSCRFSSGAQTESSSPVWGTVGQNNWWPCSSGWSSPPLYIAHTRTGWLPAAPRPWSLKADGNIAALKLNSQKNVGKLVFSLENIERATESYHPLDLDWKQHAEGKHDPDDGAHDEPEPEDPRLWIRRLLLPRALQDTDSQSQDTRGRIRMGRSRAERTFLDSNTQRLCPSSSTWFHQRRPTISLPVTFWKPTVDPETWGLPTTVSKQLAERHINSIMTSALQRWHRLYNALTKTAAKLTLTGREEDRSLNFGISSRRPFQSQTFTPSLDSKLWGFKLLDFLVLFPKQNLEI